MIGHRIGTYALCCALAFLLPFTSGHAAQENAAITNPFWSIHAW